MTPEERLIDTHLRSLSAQYGDNLKKMKFNPPVITLLERDSVVSISPSKKEAYVTRHYIAGHFQSSVPTHAVIFSGECFDRIAV
jgi:hypothetical protein